MATTKKNTSPQSAGQECEEGINSSRFGKQAPSLCWGFAEHLKYTLGADHYNATRRDLFMALAYTVRDRIMHQWIKTKQTHFEKGVKRVLPLHGVSDGTGYGKQCH